MKKLLYSVLGLLVFVGIGSASNANDKTASTIYVPKGAEVLSPGECSHVIRTNNAHLLFTKQKTHPKNLITTKSEYFLYQDTLYVLRTFTDLFFDEKEWVEVVCLKFAKADRRPR